MLDVADSSARNYRHSEIGGNTDTSFLKLLALIFMLVDHLGAAVFTRVPELRIIGRMAFPLYAWCLVVGIVHTKSPLRYMLRMLLLAVLSQPLYMMALNHTWTDYNILFALTIAIGALWGIRAKWLGSQFWAPLLCYLLLGYIKVDYGWKGLTFILLLYLSREKKSGLCATYLAYSLFWGSSSSGIKTLFDIPLNILTIPGIGQVLSAFLKLQGMVWLSLPLIALDTRVSIRIPKWLGYSLYPMHLVLLIVIRLFCGTNLSVLLRGF